MRKIITMFLFGLLLTAAGISATSASTIATTSAATGAKSKRKPFLSLTSSTPSNCAFVFPSHCYKYLNSCIHNENRENTILSFQQKQHLCPDRLNLNFELSQPRSHANFAKPLCGIKGFRTWFESTFPSAVTMVHHGNSKGKQSRQQSGSNQKNSRNKKDNKKLDTKSNAKSQSETFDHVLIDANQFLHSTLRKAYNYKSKQLKNQQQTEKEQEEFVKEVLNHSLTLLMHELNRLSTTIAIPSKSLVIALDGSPGAAKLDMQRRRRFGVYKRAEAYRKRVEILKERGFWGADTTIDSGVNGDSVNVSADAKDSALSKHDREQITLNITPGTEYMDKVVDALLYWAWKCMTNPYWPNRIDHHHGRGRGNNTGRNGQNDKEVNSEVQERTHIVKIYINPSHVPGEGEIKLLEWIMRNTNSHPLHQQKGGRIRKPHVRPGESIAILGGDSDLVLMGLVVPPSITHNIHVILPEAHRRSMVVSVWETSLMLARWMEGTSTYGRGKNKRSGRRATKKNERKLTLHEMRQIRMDAVLLIIMNGNDYLPRIRGCGGGFDSFFQIYYSLMQSWWQNDDGGIDDIDKMSRPFLTNIDSENRLSINLPFALAFFQKLSTYSQKPTTELYETSSSFQSYMSSLNNLVEGRLLPGPLEYQVIRPEESLFSNPGVNSIRVTNSTSTDTRVPSNSTTFSSLDSFQSELYQMNVGLHQNTSKVIEEICGDDVEIVRMTMGNFPQDRFSPFLNRSKSNIVNGGFEVVTTFLGESDGHGVISRMIQRDDESSTIRDRSYLFEVPHRQGNSIRQAKSRLACLALEDIFGKENIDELFGNGLEENGDFVVQSDPKSYLGGLLWNLETYHTGYCADHGYNYGRRFSPSPFDLVSFLQSMKKKGKHKLMRSDLLQYTSHAPLSNGVACLAALPPQASYLVPEPYNLLIDSNGSESFEALYKSCFDPLTNVFDANSFEEKCQAEAIRVGSSRKSAGKANNSTGNIKHSSEDMSGRHILAGNFWTVYSRFYKPLAHPFEPPQPFSEGIHKLRKNSRIRVSKIPIFSQTTEEKLDRGTPQEEYVNGDLTEKMGSEDTVPDYFAATGGTGELESRLFDEIPYKIAFRD